MKYIIVILLFGLAACETPRVVPNNELKDIRYWRD
jgi:hypothetical protein